MSKLFPALAYVGVAGAAAPNHRVLHLSEPRRDLGAAAAGGKVFFAGGCRDTDNAYVCDEATATVDVFDASGSTSKMQLSEARGWPAGCGVGSQAVFAGGGRGGNEIHSATADVLDAIGGNVSSNPQALSEGRWGVTCATVGDTVHFAGGKVMESASSFHMSAGIDSYSNGQWALSSLKLSQARESFGAVAGRAGLVFAGGWVTQRFGAHPVDTVDTFVPSQQTSEPTTTHLSSPAYWPGVVADKDGAISIVDNSALLKFYGSVWTSSPLPDALVGSSATLEDGGAVPASHVPRNGGVVGDHLCFYAWQSKTLSALYCYDSKGGSWGGPYECSAVHRGGALEVLGNSIFVAGGYDPDGQNAPTDVIDVFDFDTLLSAVV